MGYGSSAILAWSKSLGLLFSSKRDQNSSASTQVALKNHNKPQKVLARVYCKKPKAFKRQVTWDGPLCTQTQLEEAIDDQPSSAAGTWAWRFG